MAESLQELSAALDPNEAQRRASDPDYSVWVEASAGSGKTKVLTDRVLRLLLPRADDRAGSPAHKILCLTFTKAAASEMSMRVSKALARWAVMSDDELYATLSELLGGPPTSLQINAARRLFADVVDVPGGLKIMTIHSFCQSVLGRFPLEAGLNPQFSVLEESAATEILFNAQQDVVGQEEPEFTQALQAVALYLNEEQFLSVLSSFVSKRQQFFAVLEKHFGVDGFYNALCAKLDVIPAQTEGDILYAMAADEAFDYEGLKDVARVMIEVGGVHNTKRGQCIADWLSLPRSERAKAENFVCYQGGFLKKGGAEAFDKPFYGKVLDRLSCAEDVVMREAQRILEVQDKINRVKSARLTRDLLFVVEKILRLYERGKSFAGGLDYDDLIFKTLALLQGRFGDVDNSAWVQYKLDQGIDHILVDEAQDTNPNQWGVVEALIDDFFSGDAEHNKGRTLFVVGDEKQSIYSFQGASREEFSRMKSLFSEKIGHAGFPWNPVALDVSFRSTATVLDSVDAVFSSADVQQGVSDRPVRHYPFDSRAKQAGLVELWPVFDTDEVKDQYDFWDPPVEVVGMRSGSQKLADYIAAQVKGWIEGGENLPSHGRSIKAGDILVLVRRRSAFVAQLSRALKTQGVAVGGVDRMVLNDQLIVQDMIAAIKFCLLPQDDLNLACLLKSPFVGLSEQELFDLAHGREGTLWERVLERSSDQVRGYLCELISLSRNGGAYDFLSGLLQRSCPADDVSGRRSALKRLGVDASDAMNEFLSVALDFQIKEGRSLQRFVFEQTRNSSDIKREQDEGGDFVRIMTVHGAKGLQAPIVILPDTVSMPGKAANRADSKILWPDSECDLPIWVPYSDMEHQTYKSMRERSEALADDEYRRLLYVAMTRAEDRLYVCGYKGRGQVEDRSWYGLVRAGLMRLSGTVEGEDGFMRYEHGQNTDPDRKEEQGATKKQDVTMPEWLFSEVLQDVSVSNDVLRPSVMQDSARSPVDGDMSEMRFLRGNLTHKLLQILPDIEVGRREDAAKNYLDNYGRDLTEEVRGDIIRETLDVLHGSDFSEIFGPLSRSEVPVSGVIEGRGVVSGQVDRLHVNDEEVFIVDYKTNRPPPRDVSGIPESYKAQMQAYADIFRQIYPDKVVRCALLWTDGPLMMEVEV